MTEFDLNRFLEELKYLCSLDTGKYNKPGVCAADAFFAERFQALSLNVKLLHDGNEEEYAPVLTAFNGDGESFDVMFVAHLDTVFPVGTAAERPMSVNEEGIAHGPGVEDCKSGALSIYYLVRQLVESGSGIRFCAVLNSDEEVGSPHSVDFISEIAKKSKYCFVFEPGRENDDYVVKRRGSIVYTLRFHGIAAHSGSSAEKGANAIVEMARWALELQKLIDVERGIGVNVAICKGGNTMNIVPDYAELCVSFRYYDKPSLEEIRSTIERLRKNPFDSRVHVEVESEGGRVGMVPSPATEQLMERMRKVGESLNYPFGFTHSGGGSDANEASEFIPTICACGPSGFCAHTTKEYIRVNSIEPRIRLMFHLLKDLFA